MMQKLGGGGVEKEQDHDEVLKVLAKNGMEYVKVEGGAQLVKTVRGEEVKTFFEGFHVDQVCLFHGSKYNLLKKIRFYEIARPSMSLSRSLTMHAVPRWCLVQGRWHTSL